MTSIRILKATNTREVLKSRSIFIWRKARLTLTVFQIFIISPIDEISRSKELLRESSGFVDNTFKILSVIDYSKGLPLKVADLRMASATETAAGDNGA